MSIAGFDHAAIPIERVDEMLAFYERLGFVVDRTGAPLFYAAKFGENKINMHGPDLWRSGRFELRGPTAAPGCGDFCFVWSGSVGALDELLAGAGADVVEGPVERVGGGGTGTSTYVRDPDANLLEFIVYRDA